MSFDEENNHMEDVAVNDHHVEIYEEKDAHHSLPTADEIRATVTPHRKSGHVIRLITLGLVLVAFVLGLSIGLSNRGNNSPMPSAPNAGPNAGGGTTEAPTSQIPRDSFNDVVQYLSSLGVSQSNSFTTEQTPQNKAAHWLAESDPTPVSLPIGKTIEDRDGYMYAFRYVMALCYFAMGGERWANKLNFMSGTHVCNWSGVKTSPIEIDVGGVVCDSETGLPVTLDLEYNKLGGQIPTEIGLLTTLTTVALGYNELVGPVPSELCNATQLQRLLLRNNNLRGHVPDCWGRCANLTVMWLAYNDLTGTLPQSIEFCGLQKLQSLWLDFNRVQGRLPACWGNLTSMQTMFLSNNLLSGTIPSAWATLTSLTELALDDNQLLGNFPAVVDKLIHLQDLFANDNSFTGVMDDTFLAKLVDLQSVDLSNNNFTSPKNVSSDGSGPNGIPSHFFFKPKLQVMDFSSNSLKGHFPHVAVNGKLQILSLYGNNFNGGIPSDIQNLHALTHLDLSANSFHGPIHQEMGTMKYLQRLILSDLPFLQNGTIPASFLSLSNLKELSFKNTNRVGTLPNFLGVLTNLELLNLGLNHFTGTVPTSYAQLSNLKVLILNRNKINGTLPSLAQMSDLQIVMLDSTEVVGDLQYVCSLPNFENTTFNPETSGEIDVVMTADCAGNSSTVTCGCCVCCDPALEKSSNIQGICTEPLSEMLDVIWEFGFQRESYALGLNLAGKPHRSK